MNSSKFQSLSKRLTKIKEEYRGQHNIWDIGCDHGQLGLSFIGTPQIDSIHLVDPSLPVISELKNKIKSIDSYITEVVIHHQKGQTLEIKTKNNCFFIAGMGGKEMIEIINHLYTYMDSSDLLTISPHRGILELRRFLRELKVSLVFEDVVLEGKQFYQILTLKKDPAGPLVSPFGVNVWRGEAGDAYRKNLLLHLKYHKDEASKELYEYLSNI